MSQLLKFKNFINENEVPNEGGFIVTDEFVSVLEQTFGLLRKGIAYEMFAIKTHSKAKGLLNGVKIKVKAKGLASLVESLSEERYNISPDWFNSDSKDYGNLIYFIFNQNTDLKIGSYELDSTWSTKYRTYLDSKSTLWPGYGGKRSERPKEMVIEYNCESEDQFIDIFENGISDIVKELCDVKIIYLKEKEEEKNIPLELNSKIKERIKDLYQKSVVSFFETGEVESKDISISQIILDIYEETPSLFSTFKSVPEDLADDVIEKAESESYPSDFIIGLKKMQKLNKILKYN
jgi:hypothetical protein